MATQRRMIMCLFSLLFVVQDSSQSDSIIQVVPEGETQWRGDCFNRSSCTVTIEDLLQNASDFFKSNTSIQFLADQYEIKQARHNIFIRNVINLDIGGTVRDDGDQVRILCGEQFSLTIVNVTNITVRDILFMRCSGEFTSESRDVIDEYLYINRFKFVESSTIAVISSRTVQFQNIAIKNTNGFGLIAINIFKDLTLKRIILSNNLVNCLIISVKSKVSYSHLQVIYQIHNSIFEYGNIMIKTTVQLSSGLNIKLMRTKLQNEQIHVVMSNITLENNLGRFGNIQFVLNTCTEARTSINTYRLTSIYSYSSLNTNRKGILVKRIFPQECSISRKDISSEFHFIFKHTTLENSNFEFPLGYVHRNKAKVNIEIERLYINNANPIITFVNAKLMDIHMKNSLTFRMVDSTVSINGQSSFTENKNGVFYLVNTTLYVYGNTSIQNNKGPIKVLSSRVCFHGNTLIIENTSRRGGIISARYKSKIMITGSLTFKENMGDNGGAIALYEGSYIEIKQLPQKNTSLAFINNRAFSYGGAVYIEDYSFLSRSGIQYNRVIPCQLRVYDPNIEIVFKGNTATIAGNEIFGGWLVYCKQPTGTVKVKDAIQITNVSNIISNTISSTPVRVCLCKDSVPDCTIFRTSLNVTPGKSFTIEAVAVGQEFGIVPAVVRGEIFRGDDTNIKENEKNQVVGKVCTPLVYTVSFNNLLLINTSLNLRVDSFFTIKEFIRISNKVSEMILQKQVNIILQSTVCPTGFMFNKSSNVCDCNVVIIKNELDCQLQTGTVSRHVEWITATSNHTVSNNSQEVGVIVHKHCPFDYCNQKLLVLDLDYPDTQCYYNRTGILCGNCGKNLSVIFGSSNCKQCTNIWVLLIVSVVLIAGVCLVLFLTNLNLTISSGTINGLIFYANIIRANQTIFFPQDESNRFLSWFVAWLNLDIGFDVCFYNGMNAFVKTLLRFVFPLYIWLLVIIIIVASHYSVRAAQLTGNNAIQVLATLFLLSYAKLLRLTITSLTFTTLTYPDGYTEWVWLYDGNVNYLQGKHIALFLAAIAVLLFLSIPYTLILVLIQWLQRYTQYFLLQWVTKFLPLFEAHTGPYKNKYRYWPGLLLLVRVILFLVFSLNTVGDPTINLLAITITMIFLLAYSAYLGGVYKQWLLDTLECSFYINLGVTSSATLYHIESGESVRMSVVFASTGIAFVTFSIIILYHIYLKLSMTVHGAKIVIWFVSKIKRNTHKQEDADDNIVIESHSADITLPTQSIVELRELLLDT